MKNTNRRRFIGGIAAVGLVPFTGFPAVVKRRNPNSMLSHACIGTGNMARADLRGFLECDPMTKACPGMDIPLPARSL